MTDGAGNSDQKEPPMPATRAVAVNGKGRAEKAYLGLDAKYLKKAVRISVECGL